MKVLVTGVYGQHCIIMDNKKIYQYIPILKIIGHMI